MGKGRHAALSGLTPPWASLRPRSRPKGYTGPHHQALGAAGAASCPGLCRPCCPSPAPSTSLWGGRRASSISALVRRAWRVCAPHARHDAGEAPGNVVELRLPQVHGDQLPVLPFLLVLLSGTPGLVGLTRRAPRARWRAPGSPRCPFCRGPRSWSGPGPLPWVHTSKPTGVPTSFCHQTLLPSTANTGEAAWVPPSSHTRPPGEWGGAAELPLCGTPADSPSQETGCARPPRLPRACCPTPACARVCRTMPSSPVPPPLWHCQKEPPGGGSLFGPLICWYSLSSLRMP